MQVASSSPGWQNLWPALTAVASILYVVFSVLLWRAAINANRQAERANREAQRAFEFTRELWRAIYRPFLAVAWPVVEERLGQYVIEITIENKSDTVEARIGDCHLAANVAGTANLRKVREFGPQVLVPHEKLQVRIGLRTPDPQAAGTEYIVQAIRSGTSKLEFEISLPYEGPDGQKYDYYRLIEYVAAANTLRNKLTSRPPEVKAARSAP